MISASERVLMLLWVIVKIFLGGSLCFKWFQFFFIIGDILGSTYTLFGSCCTPLDITCPKWYFVSPEDDVDFNLVLIIFLDGISAWFVTRFCNDLFHQYYGRSVKISLIFCWNISPASTTPNGSLQNIYLPNWHARLVRYENFSLSFRLW